VPNELIAPIAGRHAVQKAIFSLEWSAELSEDHFGAIEAAAPRLLQLFQERAEVKQIVLNFGDPVAREKVGGIKFFKPRPDGKGDAQAFSITGNQAVVSDEDYDRWKQFRDLTQGCLEAVLPQVTSGRKLKAAALQYVDVFKWRGDPQGIDARHFIREGSPWIPQSVFRLGPANWHSHHGFFATDPPGRDLTLLENIKVNRHATGESPSLMIHTVHQLAPTGPLDDGAVLAFALDHLDELHRRNKKYLQELLTDELQEMIQLGNP
jgi:uncharacterized protein (TIGR04255 family)